MHWARVIKYMDITLEEATHLVVGEGPAFDDNGWMKGILAKSSDEFTAYRIAREINKTAGANVMVMQNRPDALDRIHEMITDMLEEQSEMDVY